MTPEMHRIALKTPKKALAHPFRAGNPECPPLCSGHLQRNLIFIFAGLENLRIFQTCPFTRGNAAKNVS